MSLRSALARVPGARSAYDIVVPLARRLRHRAHRPAKPVKPTVPPPTAAEIADARSLRKANRASRESILDAASGAVVTMTTHGSRVRTVHYAIESIARGRVRPTRMVLWLDDPSIARRLPRALKRLQKRGLEVILVERGLLVHTKYHFYVTSIAHHELPLVTSDDDIMYPATWLEDLMSAHRARPDAVTCFRAHTIATEDGAIVPYSSWRPCASDSPKFSTFGTSVSGQVFPPALLDIARDAGRQFQAVAAHNDDIWLHHLAVSAGIRIAQVDTTPQLFPFVPGSQETGLFLVNYWDGGNDRQIAATYSGDDIARIASEA